jgi:hypothetical protein
MIDPNMPQDNRGAEAYLIAKKAQLVAMAEMIVSGELETFSQVNGYIWSEVERLDAQIEGEG